MNKTKYAFFAGLLLLLCVFSLAIPALAAVWQENLLMQRPVQREETQNVLSEEARKIPIAYALHKSKLVYGSYTADGCEFTPQFKQEMLAVLQGLIDADIMPQEVYDKICDNLKSPKAEIFCRENKLGFKEISFNLTEKNGETVTKIYTQLILQWHSETGIAIRLEYEYAQLNEEKALAAFLKYLGIDVLTDWHSINENGAVYSDKGQLYVLCKQTDNRSYFTIAPVSREEILNK